MLSKRGVMKVRNSSTIEICEHHFKDLVMVRTVAESMNALPLSVQTTLGHEKQRKPPNKGGCPGS